MVAEMVYPLIEIQSAALTSISLPARFLSGTLSLKRTNPA